MRGPSTAMAVAKALRAAGVDMRIRTLVDHQIGLVMRLVEGNLSVAAQLLGVNRRSLQRRQARLRARRKTALDTRRRSRRRG